MVKRNLNSSYKNLNSVMNALENLTPQLRVGFLNKCEQRINHHENYGESFLASLWKNAYNELYENHSAEYFKMIIACKRVPPTFDEFLTSEEYLNDSLAVWPKLQTQLNLTNPHIMLGKKHHKRVVINDSTLGTGKSYGLVLSTLYKLCTLTCFDAPHLLFKNLDPTFPIFIYLLSAKPSITRSQIYQPVRDIVDTCAYFQNNTEYNKNLETSLEFSNKVTLRSALSSNATSLLSLAVLWGVIDEANFFEVVQNSKRADFGEKEYNQARKLFETLLQRYSSRFVTDVIGYGGIETTSSPLHLNDFTSWLHTNALEGTFGDSYLYIQNKKWDIAPEETYEKDGYFYYTPHSEIEASQIYEDKKDVPEGAYKIPNIYLAEFKLNPLAAQRNHLGIRTKSICPFFVLSNKITECVNDDFYGITDKQEYVLAKSKQYPKIIESKIIDKLLPRFMHVDLSYSGDRCGLAMCHVSGSTLIEYFDEKEKKTLQKKLPIFTVDFAISIEPNESNQLDISKVRQFIESLKDVYDIKLKKVTYDQFQSQESITILNSKGIITEKLSVDVKSDPYDNLYEVTTQNRIIYPNNQLLIDELLQLEKVELSKGKYKVDHPINFSKDVSDAVCGCVWNALHDPAATFILGNELVAEAVQELNIEEYENVDYNEYY